MNFLANHFHLSSKGHDILAALAGSGVIAISLSDFETWVRLVTGLFGCGFIALGFVLRAFEVSDRRRDRAKNEVPKDSE